MSGPRNTKPRAVTHAFWAKKVIPQLVDEEGYDAPAEERIVYRIAMMRPLPSEGWLNTETMRRYIQKAQQRYQPREQIDWKALEG